MASTPAAGSAGDERRRWRRGRGGFGFGAGGRRPPRGREDANQLGLTAWVGLRLLSIPPSVFLPSEPKAILSPLSLSLSSPLLLPPPPPPSSQISAGLLLRLRLPDVVFSAPPGVAACTVATSACIDDDHHSHLPPPLKEGREVGFSCLCDCGGATAADQDRCRLCRRRVGSDRRKRSWLRRAYVICGGGRSCGRRRPRRRGCLPRRRIGGTSCTGTAAGMTAAAASPSHRQPPRRRVGATRRTTRLRRRLPSATTPGPHLAARRRRPPQGGGSYDRSYPDESLGYTPSRSERYWLEEDGYKGFSRYGGGGGGGGGSRRDGRDMRGSYRRSPFRGYGSDFSRNHQEHLPPPLRRSPLRSIAVSTSYDPSGDRADRGDRDHHHRVTPWRPVRRRESRSDAGDAAGAGAVPVGQAAAAPVSEKDVSAQSLAVAAPQVSEEEAPRKKPRLGWGQGLAKYEKQKVQGPADSAEAVVEGSPTATEQKTATQTPASEPCTSPVVAAPSLSVAAPSPAPPCKSPVPEEKSCEVTNTVAESNKNIPEADVQACNNEIPITLDQLEGDPIDSLAKVLSELVQHEDSCSGDSKRLTNSSKLLLLKESISKELEKTELEIDSLEGELKSVNAEARKRTLRDPPATVTYAQDPSPSPVKEQGELTPSPNISMEQDADVKVVDPMEVETAQAHNPKAVSSEESVACPEIAQGQVSAAADVVPCDASRKIGPAIDVDNEQHEVDPCHDNLNAMKEDGSIGLTTKPCSSHDANLFHQITAVNMNEAKDASELLFKHVPADQSHLDLLTLNHLSSREKDDLIIKRKHAILKNRQRFKEQILTFKFRVLRHLWKEDVRLLSVRKQRSKSHKRTDQSNRAAQSGSQRQRSSNRSRLSVPAGNINTFPITEMSGVANKLFSEFQLKRCRNYLKMPTQIIDEKEKVGARFVSKNGLVEDPILVEKERALVNPWTREEKEVFMEKLATFGKDFSKISSFLKHKTTADCIEFYYKHHKSESFREVKKLLDLRQQQQPASNYLGAISGKKWNPEANAASLDMLGVATEVAAQGLEYANEVKKNSAKSIMRNACGADNSSKGSEDCVGDVSLHERESVAADVLAGICGTLSPEGMGSCITSSADPGQKMGISRMEHLLTPEADKNFDDDGTVSDQECEVDIVDWNDDEKSIFIEAISNYGKDFAQISSCVKSKSFEQCKVFFSKARKSLGLDMIRQSAADAGFPTGDGNGGRSGTDGACVAEMDSAICSAQSCPEMEIDACPVSDGDIQGHHPLSDIVSEPAEADKSNVPDIDVNVEESAVPDIDVNVEEGGSKAEKNHNIIVDHKQLCEDTRQTSCAHIDINCPESTDTLQDIEDVAPVNMHGNDATVEQAVAAHVDIRSSLHPVEVVESSRVSEGNSMDLSSKGRSHGSEFGKGGKSTLSVCLPANGVSKENIIHFSNMAGASSVGPAFTSNYQQSKLADPIQSKPKPLTPKDLLPVQFSSPLPDPTSICFEGIAAITTPSFKDHGSIVSIASGAKDVNMFPTFKDQSGNRHDALFHNVDGYMQHKRNNHLKTEVSILPETTISCNAGISQSDQFAVPKFQNGRSSSLGLSDANLGVLSTGNREEVREGLFRPSSVKASAGNEEQQKRPGDVKLFGQILSHQSSVQSSGSSVYGSKNKPPSPKVEKSASRLLSNSREPLIYSSRPPMIANLGLEERAMRGYDHLDGRAMHSELPSPKVEKSASTRLLSNSRERLIYSSGPPIIADLGLDASATRSYAHLDGRSMQPEPMVMVAKCQRSSAGVPVYSTKNGALSVFAEFQQPSMQSHPPDHKLMEIADLHKRNGMDLISGFQQPGRLGGPGVLVSGVSDPVAALKAQYGPGSKMLSNDVDTWKDIGSR
uniref:SANT domain-containing protein n=1 Tax=Leersia perrieri TaxID=77586 RepID=A0A0D9WCA2_9ORYZ